MTTHDQVIVQGIMGTGEQEVDEDLDEMEGTLRPQRSRWRSIRGRRSSVRQGRRKARSHSDSETPKLLHQTVTDEEPEGRVKGHTASVHRCTTVWLAVSMCAETFSGRN